MADRAKFYFQQEGTVISWWYPESRQEPLYEHYLEQLRWVISQFDWQGKRVADIGTGKGRFAISCALRGAEVYALDLSPQMLDHARRDAAQAGVKVHYLQGDAENLPYPDRSFDIVLCMETIMHVPHPDKLMAEIARVLRPDGQAIVSMTNKYRINALARLPETLYRRLRRSHSERSPLWTYSVPAFRRFFDRAGLRILKLHGQGLFQANARLRLTRQLSIPLFPRRFALWFFAQVEPRLRQGPLLNIMGTVMAIAVPK